jgi:Tannase and feruloyl esterase
VEKLAPFWDATDPDLGAFEKAGGKLILWQGEADWSIPTITSIAYYQAVVKAMGGLAATAKFASPNALVATEYAPSTTTGPGPGGGGSDLTDAVPTLGAPATTAVVRTINLYPYPELPAYKGHGNVDDASSYTGRVSAALQQPTPWLGKFDSEMIWCNNQGLDCRQTPPPPCK